MVRYLKLWFVPNFRSSNQCWVMGYWQSRGSNSQSSRWWDSPFWPGCFWKCILCFMWIGQLLTEFIGLKLVYMYWFENISNILTVFRLNIALGRQAWVSGNFACNDVVICVLLCSQRQLPAVSTLVQKDDENSYWARHNLFFPLNYKNFEKWDS